MSYYSSDMQLELLKKWRDNKDKGALELLISSNKRLIQKEASLVVKTNKNIDMEDLMQEGALGLVIAADKFDFNRNVSFITYACFWIKQRIKTYVVNNRSIVRLGTTSDGRKIFSGFSKLMNELSDENLSDFQKVNIISEELGVKIESINEMRNILSGYDISLESKPRSSSSSSEDRDSASIGDRLVDEELLFDNIEERQSILFFRKALDVILDEDLNYSERYIINKRYLAESKMTYENIGKDLDISRQSVKCIELALLKKIKSKLSTKYNVKKDSFFNT